ncbi:MAG: hypothetical protein Q8Q85_00570 [Gemmatimonadales bacterium]|nr:hypothetical protein [Gemmatimonadales bacterium]
MRSSRFGSAAVLGRLALSDYQPFVPVVARAYLARPVYEASAAPSWHALADHIDRMYQQLATRVRVELTPNDPYPDAATMQRDIARHGRMKVWQGGSDHPIWTPDQNWRFRAVHDYTVHLGGDHDFSLRGEIGAYNRHVKMAPVAARLALFVEVVGQTSCFFFTGGNFCAQKVCQVYGFDFVNVGEVDARAYLENGVDRVTVRS